MRKIVTRIITAWIALFIVFFVLTQPTGAARYIRDWYNGVHSAAVSVSRLLNSL